MVNSITSLLEIDENTARKFTFVYILENSVNNVKYSIMSTLLTAKAVYADRRECCSLFTNAVSLECISFSNILL